MPQLLNIPLTSAPSLESMNSASNLSRRMSLINPGLLADPSSSTSINLALQKIKIEEGRCQQDVSEAREDENPSQLQKQEKPVTGESQPELSVTSDLPLDPLGALVEESKDKCRRESPDAENTPQSNRQPETAVVLNSQLVNDKQPSISIHTSVPNPICSAEELHGIGKDQKLPHDYEGVPADSIVVPYLSPLVLRKELENVLDQEGDSSLVQSKFVDEHPIIYWNLVWFFHRANLPSHIKGLSLHAKSVTPVNKTTKSKDADSSKSNSEPFTIHSSWEAADHRNVLVKCLWDNPKYHEQFSTPLYQHWLQSREKPDKCNEEDSKENADNNLFK